jgi:flagellar basal-body rod modification protein FlgD
MSPEQMTAQLVQFSQVEQQIRVDASLERLIGLQQAAQLTPAAPLLGRMVEVEGDRLSLQGGAATLRLPAAGAAAEATIQVQDAASGRVLREARVALGREPRDWTWDGRDAAGQRLPDGAYRFAVAGRDSTGAAQPVEATVRARATGAERRDGELRLRLGALEVGFDRVRSLPSE